MVLVFYALDLLTKPDIDDCRESPAFAIMNLLKTQGAQVEYFDPYIPKIPSIREYSDWKHQPSIQWGKTSLSSFDAAIVVTHHTQIAYQDLLQYCPLIIDTRNALASYTASKNQVWKA